MKTGRSVLISAMLALGAAGSILAGSAAPAIAAPAVSVAAITHTPNTHLYG